MEFSTVFSMEKLSAENGKMQGKKRKRGKKCTFSLVSPFHHCHQFHNVGSLEVFLMSTGHYLFPKKQICFPGQHYSITEPFSESDLGKK